MSGPFGSSGGFSSSSAGRSSPSLFPSNSSSASPFRPTFGSPNPSESATVSLFDASYRKTSSTDTSLVNEQPDYFKKVVIENDNLKKRISFLSGFIVAFKEHAHTDIQLRPNDGPCIPAHKALLAARSKIFKNILGSDGCKVAPSDSDTITMSELNTEELESLLEFLYTGSLPFEKLKKHVFRLYIAADKYEIPYLHESCETYMQNSLNRSNALDIFEISDSHSSKTLKEITLNFIIENMKDIVSTHKYEDFALNNPNLCVQITKTFVNAKCKCNPQ